MRKNPSRSTLNARTARLKGFTFQKNGANGSRIAGALYVREPYAFLVRQHVSPPTALSTEDIHIEARAGKGRMYVMALMDDVVTGVERVPSR